MSQTWNKFSKASNHPPSLKEMAETNWKKDCSSNIPNSSSTFSLHITAHKSSFEAVTFDSFNDNKEILKNDKFGSIKKPEILDTSTTFFIQNPFEFPRQQQNFEISEPEICQYKAFQRLLLNPNEAPSIFQQEIWMFLWFLIFAVSIGAMISITCKKGHQPSATKKQQQPKQKNANLEPTKLKKSDIKDEKKVGEKNKNKIIEKSPNTTTPSPSNNANDQKLKSTEKKFKPKKILPHADENDTVYGYKDSISEHIFDKDPDFESSENEKIKLFVVKR
uniref:Uncharacterized protein n=1 Tax=Panagrolaimus sp. PS1159 TaxID=55785 RepID=A0AC35FW86_9BILA